jgi:hypothetical protein
MKLLISVFLINSKHLGSKSLSQKFRWKKSTKKAKQTPQFQEKTAFDLVNFLLLKTVKNRLIKIFSSLSFIKAKQWIMLLGLNFISIGFMVFAYLCSRLN